MDSEIDVGGIESLEEYLERRSRLGNQATQFRCPDSCPRYGCKDPELHVPVTLMDLLLQSLSLTARPSEIYDRFYKIGWSPEKEVPWIGRFTLELQKPCGFLEGQWCGIYPARPVGCAEFPEAWYLRGYENRLPMNRGRFHDYPCLKGTLPISSERKKHLAVLSEMGAQEQWLSDFYLFGFSPFYVDMRNLVEELVEIAKRHGVAPDRIDPEVPHMIPYFLVEGIFQKKLKQAGISAQILEKVVCLDNPRTRASFFGLKALTDKMRESCGLDNVLIYHRLEGNTLRSHNGGRRRRFRLKTTKVSIEGIDNGRERKEKRA